MDAPAKSLISRPNRSFREIYCETRKCESEMFERHLFACAVRRRWRWVAILFLHWWPKAFKRDLGGLTSIGNSRSLDELTVAATELLHNPREPRTFLRDGLGVRVSGRQLLAEADAAWREERAVSSETK